MKIVQSLWSKPGTETGGWSEKVFYYMSWALSCLKLKEHHGSIELYTDKKGKELLVDTLGLPYDKVHVVLDDLNGYHPMLWALGKIYTYSLQKEPFIHVDGDVYIWDKFPDRFTDAPLIAQNREENYEHNVMYAHELVANGFEFEEYLNPGYDTDIIEANAGILGGNNIDFFQLYAEKVFDFISRNKHLIDSCGENVDGYINTIFEQYFFYKLATRQEIEIEYFYKHHIDSSFSELVQFASLPYQKTYIHALGYHKRTYRIGERVAERLWYEYPEYYQKVLDIIQKNK